MKRRSTASKEEILEVLAASGNALSHEMIQDRVSSAMDRATIYRVLNRFCEDGKVHKVVGDNGKQYFAMCANCDEKKQLHSHNHIHFRCLQCGTVECLKQALSVPLPEGYVAKVHNLVISGFCKACS
ncbi:Fur family transcriptional regulator [Mesonia aquimarina]|uniref:Fur family transcriptional regulator n=1 Tax=Mesonia aquimarina TaxID=1504967 RepID=UPI000EF61AAC|nr:transcriptional repressor [Mesonia aquimarina]